jgi:hypothetical protein
MNRLSFLWLIRRELWIGVWEIEILQKVLHLKLTHFIF